MNGKIIAATSIGLVAGLIFGVLIGVFLLPEVLNPISAGTNNQVQMSGTVQATQTGTIEFNEVYSLNTTHVQSSAPIKDGTYSVLLVGGKSYNVYVSNEDGYSRGDYSIYVPEGVTTFTANF